MAFGAPRVSQLVAYVLLVILACVGACVFGRWWLRLGCSVFVVYGVLCIILTNAWTVLLPSKRVGEAEEAGESDADDRGNIS